MTQDVIKASSQEIKISKNQSSKWVTPDANLKQKMKTTAYSLTFVRIRIVYFEPVVFSLGVL